MIGVSRAKYGLTLDQVWPISPLVQGCAKESMSSLALLLSELVIAAVLSPVKRYSSKKACLSYQVCDADYHHSTNELRAVMPVSNAPARLAAL